MNTDPPFVDAYVITPIASCPGSFCVSLWCVFCKVPHDHGWSPGGVQHRHAHCAKTTPYSDGGYVLRVLGGEPPWHSRGKGWVLHK